MLSFISEVVRRCVLMLISTPCHLLGAGAGSITILSTINMVLVPGLVLSIINMVSEAGLDG